MTKTESLRKFGAACEKELRGHRIEETLAPDQTSLLDWVNARIQALDLLQQGYLKRKLW